jgi:hypothetical protein
MRAAVVVLPALLLAAAARAEEKTWNLRARHVPAVGEKTRNEERTRNRVKYAMVGGGQTLQSAEQVEGIEQTYDQEVQAVDAKKREVTKAIRTYSAIVDHASGEKLDLSAKPIRVQMSCSEQGDVKFEPLDGAVVPPLLQGVLDMESGRRTAEGGEEDEEQQLFPAEPVAVGATWTIPLEVAARMFNMGDGEEGAPAAPAPGAPPPGVDAEKSKATGKLEATEVVGGVTLLRITITIDMTLTRFQGMACKEPMRFEGTVKFRLAADGASPVGDAEFTAKLKGKTIVPPEAGQGMPKDTVVDFDLELGNGKKVTALP